MQRVSIISTKAVLIERDQDVTRLLRGFYPLLPVAVYQLCKEGVSWINPLKVM